MFSGFDTFDIAVHGETEAGPVNLHGVLAGHGPPVLLLHGFPQNHTMWHRIAPALARDHTVVAADLRGYGDSAQPPSGPDHAGYSFRAMAADQVALMAHFGFDRFAVVGHDRGARVAHRMALDHPRVVDRLALLDILPTAFVYSHIDQRLATAYYHWFFFVQSFDLPERMIAADPTWYLHRLLGGWGSGLDAHDPAAVAQYERCFADPGRRHAMLEDYRAAASIDLEHDAASEASGVLIAAPAFVLWGEVGVVGGGLDRPLDVWRSQAADPALVTGGAVTGAGHFLVDEEPDQTLAALEGFLAPT